MKKRKLLLSFSGGRTSAYMTKWCLDNLSDQYDMIVVFANTGKERDETLNFVNECDVRFGFNTVWIEAVIMPTKGEGTQFKIVDYETANRDGSVFVDMSKKYGVPNVAFPHCTRELKTVPIHKYVKSIGWDNYYTAIGIRSDEVDRMSSSYKEQRFIYPLINMIPTTKYDINKFWTSQAFDLELKSYEGNCDLCFKKSERKILTLLKENPKLYQWWYNLEKEIGNGYKIYRKNESIMDLIKRSKGSFIESRDESKDIIYHKQLSLLDDLDISNGCEESCEPFAVNY